MVAGAKQTDKHRKACLRRWNRFVEWVKQHFNMDEETYLQYYLDQAELIGETVLLTAGAAVHKANAGKQLSRASRKSATAATAALAQASGGCGGGAEEDSADEEQAKDEGEDEGEGEGEGEGEAEEGALDVPDHMDDEVYEQFTKNKAAQIVLKYVLANLLRSRNGSIDASVKAHETSAAAQFSVGGKHSMSRFLDPFKHPSMNPWRTHLTSFKNKVNLTSKGSSHVEPDQFRASNVWGLTEETLAKLQTRNVNAATLVFVAVLFRTIHAYFKCRGETVGDLELGWMSIGAEAHTPFGVVPRLRIAENKVIKKEKRAGTAPTARGGELHQATRSYPVFSVPGDVFMCPALAFAMLMLIFAKEHTLACAVAGVHQPPREESEEEEEEGEEEGVRGFKLEFMAAKGAGTNRAYFIPAVEHGGNLNFTSSASASWVQKEFLRALRAVGVDTTGMTIAVIRHSAFIWLLRMGVPGDYHMIIAQWASVKMRMVYAEAAPNDLTDALRMSVGMPKLPLPAPLAPRAPYVIPAFDMLRELPVGSAWEQRPLAWARLQVQAAFGAKPPPPGAAREITLMWLARRLQEREAMGQRMAPPTMLASLASSAASAAAGAYAGGAYAGAYGALAGGAAGAAMGAATGAAGAHFSSGEFGAWGLIWGSVCAAAATRLDLPFFAAAGIMFALAASFVCLAGHLRLFLYRCESLLGLTHHAHTHTRTHTRTHWHHSTQASTASSSSGTRQPGLRCRRRSWPAATAATATATRPR
jgi:hypothetical protein